MVTMYKSYSILNPICVSYNIQRQNKIQRARYTNIRMYFWDYMHIFILFFKMLITPYPQLSIMIIEWTDVNWHISSITIRLLSSTQSLKSWWCFIFEWLHALLRTREKHAPTENAVSCKIMHCRAMSINYLGN